MSNDAILGCVILLASWAAVLGQEPDAAAAHGRPQSAGASPAPAQGAATEVDSAAVRAATLERLKASEPPVAAGSAPASPDSTSVSSLPAVTSDSASVASSSADLTLKKSLPALLHDRLRWLNEYDAAAAALEKATHPEPSPAQQAAEAREELARLRTILSRASQAPDALLPPVFRTKSDKSAGPLGSEMKDAIEATASELKDWKSKLEALRAEISKWNGLMNARRSERDSLFQRVTALGAKSTEFKSAVTDALTPGDRRLAHERLVNFDWQLRVESLRLRVIEAQIALELKLVDVRELRAEVCRAHVEIASKTLEPMQAHYRLIAEDQERALTRAKAKEEKKALSSNDPLERFRARRTAELLALEALVIKSEQSLVVPPDPSYEEQKTLADRADFDFANIKELLDDGKVSRLDAIRLNNEFRRIGPERERLLKNEMAKVESQIQFYENTLTAVELELLQNSMHDRFEHDLLRERASPARWAEGEAMIRELEGKYRSLLLRRQRALEKLSEGASHTLVQVTRRLGILEQEYGFIRTTIFWVRDREPIGPLTITQAAHEFNVLVKGLVRLAEETVKPNLWGQPSGEFVVVAVAVLIFPVGMVRLRRVLGEQNRMPMQALRSLALGLARAAAWPLYLVILAYAARVGPWPRSLGILVSAGSTGAAIALFGHDSLRWLMGPSGWPERSLGLPKAVARQVGAAARFVVVAAVVFMLPIYLFDHELIAPEGKPITAPSLGRLLFLGYELLVWATCIRLLGRSSPLLEWISIPRSPASELEPSGAPRSATETTTTTLPGAIPFHLSASAWLYAGLLWLGRRRRAVAVVVLAAMAAIIVLDVRGYSFTSRRLAAGGLQSAVAIAVAAAVYRAIAQAISDHAWRWTRTDRSWAMALTSAVVLRTRLHARGPVAESIGAASPAEMDIAVAADNDDDGVTVDDLVVGLRRLSAYAVAGLTLLVIAWIWEVDMALVQFLINKPLWDKDGPSPVTVGDVTQAGVVILLGTLAWRYMNALFALTVFPRMPDDPGVRFAVVTLCRYAVLGLTSLIALAAIHLDLAKISVVLAALGVGLGFGLQEIVSNFVCGIILLLERPIRIGDVVTVAGTTGKVDRINIRATTIINGDNQSMIVPNREFITGNLVNWTLKDKILRVQIKMSVAYGSDPDRVVDLLLRVARADADVMINPAPTAALEGFGESSLLFALATFVPDPGLAGTVRHRLCAEIQRRFTAEGIVIPYPTQELHVNNRELSGWSRAVESAQGDAPATHPHRFDPAAKALQPPHLAAAAAQAGTTSRPEDFARPGTDH